MAIQHKTPDDNIKTEHSCDTCSIEHSITALANAISRHRANILARHGLTALGYEILRLLLSEKQLTMSGLTRAAHANLSHTSRDVDRLVHRGLLHRWRLATDRRVVLVRLTQHGAELAHDLQTFENDQENSFTKGLKAKHIDTFRRLARKMLDNIDETYPTRY